RSRAALARGWCLPLWPCNRTAISASSVVQNAMNKRWVLFHLGEALGELQKVATALESGPVGEEEFEIAIEHAYHHLNTAWNSRLITDDQAKEHTDSDFVN